MHTRENVMPKVATMLLIFATLVASWPRAHAGDRASVTETVEAKSPKKTKRKRAGATHHEHGATTDGTPSLALRWGSGPWWYRTSDQRLAAAERNEVVDVVLAAARAQLGKPYRWAGTGPATFDCSGLTRFAWAAAGVALPHSSSGQSATVQRVPLGQLRRGDLVFSGSGRISHVGIYIGEGRMIHAPHSGRSVEIAPLRTNLITAGRPE